MQVELFARMENGTHVLGQTRTAKSEAGHKIMPRDVELGIAAEDVHHCIRVHFRLLADRGDLVSEGDLQSVKGVAGIFHNEWLSWLKHENRSRCFGIERAQRVFGGRAVHPQDSERRVLEITD